MPTKYKTFAEQLTMLAAEKPEHILFSEFNAKGEQVGSVTCKALYHTSYHFANMLNKYARGSRILIYCPDGLFHIKAFSSCLFSHCTSVPLNAMGTDKNSERLIHVKNDCQPCAVVTTREIFSVTNQEHPDFFAGLDVLFIDDSEVSFDTIVKPNYAVLSSRLAIILYTSGSTSTPKGVCITEYNAYYNAQAISEAFSIERGDIGCSWLPMHHDMGLFGFVYQPIFSAITTAIIPTKDFLRRPLVWLDVISKQGCTITVAPTFAYNMLSRLLAKKTQSAHSFDLSKLRIAACGAEKVNRNVIERFAKLCKPYRLNPDALWAVYGAAEATLYVSGTVPLLGAPYLAPKWSADNSFYHFTLKNTEACNIPRHACCGFPPQQIQVKVLRYDSDEELSEQVAGEIVYFGKSVTPGYFDINDIDQLDVSQEKINTHRSRDIGFFHEGRLYVIGRIDNCIVINGENHFLEDINATIARVLDLPSVVGIVLPPNEDTLGNIDIIIERTSEVLKNDHLFPKIFTELAKTHGLHVTHLHLARRNALPYTTSGKISVWKAVELFAANKLSITNSYTNNRDTFYRRRATSSSIATDSDNNRQNTIQTLRSILIESGYQGILSADTSIQDLALNSIEIFTFLARVSDFYNIDINLFQFRELTTIAELASLIEQRARDTIADFCSYVTDCDHLILNPTPLQQSYIVQRFGDPNDAQQANIVVQLRIPSITIHKFSSIWKKLLQHYTALQIYIDQHFQFRLIDDHFINYYQPDVIDLTPFSANDIEQRVNSDMNISLHRHFDSEWWPHFHLTLYKTLDGIIVQLVFDQLMFDAYSDFTIVNHFVELLNDVQNGYQLPKDSLSEYMLKTSNSAKHTRRVDIAKNYWSNKLDTIPDGPRLNFRRDSVKASTLYRLETSLSVSMAFDKRLRDNNIYATAYFLTMYMAVLKANCNQDHFTVLMPVDGRILGAVHPPPVGNFTRCILITSPDDWNLSMIDLINRVEKSIHTAYNHRHFCGIETARALSRKRQVQISVGEVVFTSILHLSERMRWINQIHRVRSNTPGVGIDMQLMKVNGKYIAGWDVRSNLYLKADIEQLVSEYHRLVEWGSSVDWKANSINMIGN